MSQQNTINDYRSKATGTVISSQTEKNKSPLKSNHSFQSIGHSPNNSISLVSSNSGNSTKKPSLGARFCEGLLYVVTFRWVVDFAVYVFALASGRSSLGRVGREENEKETLSKELDDLVKGILTLTKELTPTNELGKGQSSSESYKALVKDLSEKIAKTRAFLFEKSSSLTETQIEEVTKRLEDCFPTVLSLSISETVQKIGSEKLSESDFWRLNFPNKLSDLGSWKPLKGILLILLSSDQERFLKVIGCLNDSGFFQKFLKDKEIIDATGWSQKGAHVFHMEFLRRFLTEELLGSGAFYNNFPYLFKEAFDKSQSDSQNEKKEGEEALWRLGRFYELCRARGNSNSDFIRKKIIGSFIDDILESPNDKETEKRISYSKKGLNYLFNLKDHNNKPLKTETQSLGSDGNFDKKVHSEFVRQAIKNKPWGDLKNFLNENFSGYRSMCIDGMTNTPKDVDGKAYEDLKPHLERAGLLEKLSENDFYALLPKKRDEICSQLAIYNKKVSICNRVCEGLNEIN